MSYKLVFFLKMTYLSTEKKHVLLFILLVELLLEIRTHLLFFSALFMTFSNFLKSCLTLFTLNHILNQICSHKYEFLFQFKHALKVG